jgi:hypothetical protein
VPAKIAAVSLIVTTLAPGGGGGPPPLGLLVCGAGGAPQPRSKIADIAHKTTNRIVARHKIVDHWLLIMTLETCSSSDFGPIRL